jgi:hypothetical protein
MTKFGKVLVLFTLAVSLLMMGFALAVSTNRIDWSDRPPKDGDPGGMLAQRDAEAKQLWAKLRLAESGWRLGQAALARDEAQRVQDRLWYQTELVHLYTGATPNNPCREVVYAKAGRPQPVPEPDPRNFGRPQMAPAKDAAGQPLLSRDAYDKRDEAIHKDTLAAVDKFQKAVERDTQLTNELVGDPLKRTKGLRQRINDERAKRADVVAEAGFIRPLLINTVVESELILKRQKSLKARVGELEKEKVAGAAGR